MRARTVGDGGGGRVRNCGKPRLGSAAVTFCDHRFSHGSHGSRVAGFSYVGATPSWKTDDELDLRFYLLDAPGLAANMRSNLGPQLEAMRLGLSGVDSSCSDPEAAMVERFEHASRAARVHRVLSALDAGHVEVLSAAFSAERLPREVRTAYGDELGPVVLWLERRGGVRRGDAGAAELAEKVLQLAKAAYAACRAAS
jgi:hypothetical protein